MKTIGTIDCLWRYPVKSFLGETCEQLKIEERGVEGDRWFAVTNADGKFGSGKTTRRFRKIEGLFEFESRYREGQPEITFPDKTTLMGNDPALNEILSKVLGQSVTLNQEASIPHFDAGPIHIVTTGSLNWLSSQLPQATIDPRRFRPNILLQTADEKFLEQEWIGKTIKLGEVILEVTDATERCVMTTLPQAELPNNPEIMRWIAKESDRNFGVYAKVIQSGNIFSNDDVHLLD